MNLMQVSLKDAANLVTAVGATNTVLIEGEPGCGKSTILKHIAAAMPDLQPAYIDCATLDLGDLGMPLVDRELGVTTYAPNDRFHVRAGSTRPVAIMLDELGKAPKPVLNMLLPLVQERRLGNVQLPPGSIVFATTNLATDGVSDSVPAHGYNRLITVKMRKPNDDEWLQWADGAGVAPEVLTFAKQFPQVFESYTDSAKCDNKYIFNPLRGQTKQFVSPRSLEAASNIVKQRMILGDDLTMSALAGAIGEAAARDLQAMLSFSRNLPTNAEIARDPTKAKQPGDGIEAFYMAFRLAATLDKTTVAPFTTYMSLAESNEAKVLFASTVMSQTSRVAVAAMHKPFVDMASKLGKFL